MHNPGSQPARWLEHAPASDPGRVRIPGQDHRPGTDPRRRRRTKILALLAAAALCLAGFAIVQLTTGPAKPLPAPVIRRSQRLGAVAWPAYGESAADISGVGLVPGPGATRPVPIASVLAAWRQAGSRKTLIIAATLGQPGTMRTMLPNALQAGNALVLSLDDALSRQPR